MTALAIVALVLAGVSLVRVRISEWPLTPAMLYVAVGVLLGPDVSGILELELGDEAIVVLAELTLAVLLFADAARLQFTKTTSFAVPARLLGIGLPLTIALGAGLTALLLGELSFAEAALVAAILAPTDAALGEAVVANPVVPSRIRQALNVESGLNDGLVVPVVAVLAGVVAGETLDEPGRLAGEAVLEVAIGVGIGVAVAFVFARVTQFVRSRHWTDAEGLRLVALGAALVAYGGTIAADGSGFVAAFVCGLAARAFAGEELCANVEFAEDLGQLGTAAVFVVFGAVLVVPAFDEISLAVIICAFGTLTVVRMVPVAVAMIGSGLRAPTVAFLGWFGPRGLASMVFGLLLLADPDIDRSTELFSTIVVVIVLSVVLHGATAAPLARRYAAWFAGATSPTDMPEESMHVDVGRVRRSR